MASAQAHHSGVDVDTSRSITISGTIKEFEWANPHCWLYVRVPNDHGGSVLYGIEGPPVIEMSKLGVRNKTFKVGERVQVQFNPRKDGKLIGSGLVSVTLLETGQEFRPHGTIS